MHLLTSYNPNSFEEKYFEELKVKAEEEEKDSQKEASQASQATTTEPKETKAPSKTSPTNPEHDLDVFLLGDLGSDDEGPGMLLTNLDLTLLISFYFFSHSCR